jgi:hypothetical protein
MSGMHPHTCEISISIFNKLSLRTVPKQDDPGVSAWRAVSSSSMAFSGVFYFTIPLKYNKGC